MSVMPYSPAGQAGDLGQRIIVSFIALGVMVLVMSLIGAWLAAGAPPPPPARNPFGVGAREAAPAATGLGALIIGWQGQFYRELTTTLRLVKDSAPALLTLLGLGFGYGVIHAAGPGHGKAVISAYILSDDRSAVWRGFGLSLAAALVQAAIAIGLVLVLTIALKATAPTMNAATRWIEIVSFAAITALGLAVLWRKSGMLVGAAHGDAVACAPGCAHDALLPAPQPRSWRDVIGVVLAAGLRPCAGAIIVLVFSVSQGLFWTGIGATLAMSLGTALTTGSIALMAVMAKRLALGLASGRGNRAAIIVRSLECLAAAFVAALGALLLFGYWSAGAS
jgi:ABC-type nickel/cobalt efflux system permease component RcnA